MFKHAFKKFFSQGPRCAFHADFSREALAGGRVTKATVSSRENAVRVCEVVAGDNVQQLVLSNPARKKQRWKLEEKRAESENIVCKQVQN